MGKVKYALPWALIGVVTMLTWGQAPSDKMRTQARTAAAAANQFGAKLLADEASHKRHENIFLSPLSIFLALSMTENGAAGQTRAAMRNTLAIPADLSEDAYQEDASALSQVLRSKTDIELSIANALWADQKIQLADGFVKRAKDYYDASASSLDFRKPQAADAINSWVSEHTQGKIPTIVTPAMVRTAEVILTNAVYFRGRWRDPFDQRQTQDEVFHKVSGERKVPMMHHSRLEDAYRSGNGYEAARLPYRSSGVAMYAILPAAGQSPEQALADISVPNLLHSPERSELDLRLPRFSLNYDTLLKDPLGRMGMGIAFEKDKADFSRMASSKLWIDDVVHKTRLEVDEVGTVAAAATGTRMAAAAMIKRERKTLVFDRPFAVLLCDEQTDAVLFAGVIYDPGP